MPNTQYTIKGSHSMDIAGQMHEGWYILC